MCECTDSTVPDCVCGCSTGSLGVADTGLDGVLLTTRVVEWAEECAVDSAAGMVCALCLLDCVCACVDSVVMFCVCVCSPE
jgi:hypothetical protein